MNIFVTIGTYQPFDRLIKTIDAWLERSPEIKCIAQIGEGNYIPKNMKYERLLSESNFNEIFDNSDLIISHAGMGTIISCLQKKKPLITLPRVKKYGEHVNDHQLTNAIIFAKIGYIYPIFNTKELISRLDNIEEIKVLKEVSEYANKPLINFLREII